MSYLQLVITFQEARISISLQEFVEAQKNQEKAQAQRTTRRTIDHHLGDLVFELFFDFFRKKCSLVRPNCRRVGLLSDFFGNYCPFLCVRPVFALPNELREY